MAYTIELYANNVRTTLAGSANNTVTTLVLQSGAGALLPSPNNLIGEYAKVTLQDLATGLRNEIVYITARTGDILTVVRGQDGSAAQTWSAGDIVFEGVTAATLGNFVQPSKLQSGQYVFATATGTTTAYIATLTPAVAVLTDGMIISVDTDTVGTNTTTNPTLNVNGLGVITIVKQGGALRVGDMPTFSQLQYNATLTQWVLLNPDNSASLVPVGAVFPFSGNGSAPIGYIFDDGAELSRTAYADLFALWVTNAGFTSQNFTVTIANPGVFTKVAHGFTNGARLRLSTTGALPTGLNNTSDYFVEKLTNDTFYLSASVFGVATRIITTGTQSGTHSCLQSLHGLGNGATTFNAPNGRGLFYRSADKGRGIDNNRSIGTSQKGSLHSFDTATPCVVGDNSTLSGSTGAAQIELGYDGAIISNYPLAKYVEITAGTSSFGIVNTAEIGCGMTRPANIAMQYIIKY